MSDERQAETLVITSHHPNAPRPMPQPPANAYVGYFQNQHGEQWLYVMDPTVGVPMLSGGDVDWEQRPVEGGIVPGWVLDEDEALWLRACWQATMAQRRAVGEA